MKFLTITRTTVFIVFFLTTGTHAQSQTLPATIAALIEKVKKSHGDERRKAMNALKRELRHHNKKHRNAVMLQLRRVLSTPGTSGGKTPHRVSSSEMKVPMPVPSTGGTPAASIPHQSLPSPIPATPPSPTGPGKTTPHHTVPPPAPKTPIPKTVPHPNNIPKGFR